MDNEEVIILGGLIRDKETEGESRVPVLGQIPGLGILFRSRQNQVEKQNLLVFLRPTVLETRADITAQTERKYGAVYEVEITGKPASDRLSDLFDGVQ